ncbi:MAG: DNA topoisomerase VI subunit B [Deltaproteobacteria bacterium]|nr:DNA topoisomerase VI subunit B [Deltaproteobacteria bacterium]
MATQKITSSSTAEYFSKNLQQVGFSSQTKAVLTTLKESVDNALDACEDGGLLPEVSVEIEKLGAGSLKSADKIRIKVEDNGPGIHADMIAAVFGEYLASSKFGRGRCSRGQQGIGISAATTWAQLTNAQGALVISKTKDMRKAVKAFVEVDIKHNKGVLKNRETIDWDRPTGVSVEFVIDGRIMLNGEGGLLSYLNGTALVNPHLTLKYKLPDEEWQTIERVSNVIPQIPGATEPHPHTMKLGEFIAHSHLFGRMKASAWLRKGFSRVSDGSIAEIKKAGLKSSLLEKHVDALAEPDFRGIYTAIQNTPLMAPSTRSVLTIGEEALSKAVSRLGSVDFFSVVTRKPTICDFKPVEVEVAVARMLDSKQYDPESGVTVLRFANRVPLQFDKSACAIVKAIETVNWRAYGLQQPKDSIPLGPYVVAVSVVSPFIKFKNASKETIDASDELVEEIRRALIQAGQRLSRHIRREEKANALEEKLRYIEQFCPILVEGICRITKASDSRKKKAEEGIIKILGRDAREAEKDLKEAHESLEEHLESGAVKRASGDEDVIDTHMEHLKVGKQEAPRAAAKRLAKISEKPVALSKSAKAGKSKKSVTPANQEVFDFAKSAGGRK